MVSRIASRCCGCIAVMLLLAGNLLLLPSEAAAYETYGGDCKAERNGTCTNISCSKACGQYENGCPC